MEYGLFDDEGNLPEQYCEWAINFGSDDKRLYVDWHLAKPVYLLQEKSMEHDGQVMYLKYPTRPGEEGFDESIL